ncbi:carbohydrate ABC transporter permease [Kineothrix sp. MB12-C1]|uniref:carbohydrate ABC transporter permease n=1 Tax=Kineothrix sp. MB12-C1 TaxID=3070215 RepID=UPI0027D292AC|nr:sugar ABC transporter permease [Kineothrix sp. MB12-C1]WMC93995.1 sugar ABC transporter permease [Kineothrix sp. MB12-C1]
MEMKDQKIYPIAYILPVLVIFFTFSFLPGLVSIGYSFTNWNSFTDEVDFIGMENYKQIFLEGKQYLGYIKNTFVFAVVTTILKTVIGFLFALLFTSNIKGKGIHRTIIFSPQVMSALIVSLVFRAMLQPTRGFLNVFLRSIGLDFLAKSWLTDLSLAFPSVMAVDTWKGVGYIMVVLISGMQSIPPEYYEAAAVDGATGIQRVHYIMLPLLKPIFISCTVLNLTYGFRVFDIVYALTGGGPGYATSVINTAVFKSFSDGNYGMGSALSSILFVFLMALSYFIIKFQEGKVES